jgi:peptidoglycan/LPS O-acetylase OafA/YrhL
MGDESRVGMGVFRHDINGMRALAVLGVILFHLDIPSVGGGFLGVDVFFVISGYLITRSILNEVGEGRFSFAAFYYRRARRLFPALLVTIAASMLVGVLVFAPMDLLGLARSAVWSLAWLSNFYFWIDTNYFAAEASTKPLLHLWSLSVEEQFYLFWPLVLLFAWRWRTAAGVFTIIAVLFAAGLLMAEWATRELPAAAFFLTPFRVFEFSTGGLVVWSERRSRMPSALSSALVIGGFAVIVASFMLFDEVTGAPGLNSLVICVAAAALIHAGPSPLADHVLANPASSYIGRISYSLYLAHWPLVVFYRYAVFRDITAPEKLGLFVATFALGAALYHLVEQRYRHHDFLGPTARLTRTAGIALVALVAMGAGLAWSGKGWAWRSANYFVPGYVDIQLVRRRMTDISELCGNRNPDTCWEVVETERMRVLVIGDSHGPDGFNMILPALGGEYLILDSLPGCPPISMRSALARRPLVGGCLDLNSSRDDPAYLGKFDVVVISVLWSWYRPGNLREFLDDVRAANSDAKVIVFGNYIVTDTLCWQILERTGSKDCFADRYVKSRFLYEDELRQVAADYGYLFVSKKEAFCDGRECRLFVDDTKAIPFTWDLHHLSYEFARLAGEAVRDEIREYVYGAAEP